MDTSQKAVGQRLKELRKYQKLSGQAVGELLGVTKSTISLIESGTNKLSYEYALIIAKHLNSSVDWLLSGKGDMLPRGVQPGSQSVSAGRNATGITQAGGNVNGSEGGLVSELRKEIQHLNKLLEEKERMIQILLKQQG